MTTVSQIRTGMTGLKVTAKVVRKWKDSLSAYKPHAYAMLDDGTGQIRLNLWRAQVEQVEAGDTVLLRDAFARGRRGITELSTWEEVIEVRKGHKPKGPAIKQSTEGAAQPELKRKEWTFP